MPAQDDNGYKVYWENAVQVGNLEKSEIGLLH